MYLDLFKLKEYPFSTECDERYFYESPAHAEAMANMVYCIEQRKGMVLITGEIGAGKTLLARMLGRRLEKVVKVAMVSHPCHSARELLRSVAEELGIAVAREDDTRDLVVKLESRLRHIRQYGRTALLILDEVQSMQDEALEEVRMLWNFEHEGRRLMQFVLIGQPELRDRLRLAQWESLQQRIVLAYHIGALNAADTARYVLHRRQIAALAGCPLRFTARALETIHRATGGAPRRINVVCDNALLVAYAAEQTKITSTIINKVVREMTCWGSDYAPLMPDGDDETPRDEAPGTSLRLHREAAGE